MITMFNVLLSVPLNNVCCAIQHEISSVPGLNKSCINKIKCINEISICCSCKNMPLLDVSTKICVLRQGPVVCAFHIPELEYQCLKLTSICVFYTPTSRNMEILKCI